MSNWNEYSSPQSPLQQKPVTIASASSIAADLVKTKMLVVTGTTAIATLGVPAVLVGCYHELVLVFTNANPGGVTTGGNIANVVDPAQNVPVLLFYNPLTALYYAQ